MHIQLLQALNFGQKKLSENMIESAHSESKMLLKYLLRYTTHQLLLNTESNISKEDFDQYKSLLELRCAGTPIHYIIKYKDFWKHKIYIKEKVLIPRHDTETLVECAIEIFKRKKNITMLELGIGSGCIFLSLIKELNIKKAIGIDISKAAIKNTLTNLEKHKIKKNLYSLFLESWSSFVRQKIKVDLIVSNPPYISNNEISNLDKKIRLHEPRKALSGGAIGIEKPIQIIKVAKKLLKKDGYLIMEAGKSQSFKKIALQFGMKVEAIKKDINKIQRVHVFKLLNE